jgi:hypothetical protein
MCEISQKQCDMAATFELTIGIVRCCFDVPVAGSSAHLGWFQLLHWRGLVFSREDSQW